MGDLKLKQRTNGSLVNRMEWQHLAIGGGALVLAVVLQQQVSEVRYSRWSRVKENIVNCLAMVCTASTHLKFELLLKLANTDGDLCDSSSR